MTLFTDILILIGLTLLPFLELRASIPYGFIKTDLHWTAIFLICVITNIILGPIIYLLIDKIVKILCKIRFIERLWHRYVEKLQHKIHYYVKKYGDIGVAIFIGIPLPGSGVYSGAIGSYIIGLNFKKFLKAAILGVLIAGVIVTIVMLTGTSAFRLFVKV